MLHAFETDDPNETAPDWLAGHLVAWSGIPYGILGLVARGGMAELFLAASRDARPGEPPCVIKRLRSGGTWERSVIEMFDREAQVALRLDHPNIASHFGAGESQGRPFLVMEYLEGQSLAALTAALSSRGDGLSPELCADIMARVARALDYVHHVDDEGGVPLEIVHRDVCPRNIMLGYDGFVKLIDFGIASSRLAPDSLEVGVVKGKPNYMSPEQASGRRADRRSDVFSAGVVLWELLARERFAGSSAPPERRYRLPFAHVPRVSEVNPDVDPALDAIVARAMERDPDDRYQTAGELAQALYAYLAERPDADGRPELSFRMQSVFAQLRRDTRTRVGELVAASLDRTGERLAIRPEAPSGVRANGNLGDDDTTATSVKDDPIVITIDLDDWVSS